MGIGTSALLGSTNKFFMPWLIPRNDRNSIFQANFFGKLAGRTKRNNDRIDVPIQADARYGNENYGGYSELDMFSMRLEYCEEKSIKCLTHDTAFGMRLDAPIPDVNARYGKCKSIFDECLKAQIAQY